MKNICIVGSGAWGTALALTAHRAGQHVTLITRQPQETPSFPGVSLPPDLVISSDLTVLKEADIALQVTPAQTIQETCLRVQPYLSPKACWVICSKGIFLGNPDQTQKPQLLSDVSRKILPNPMAILSGPSFADEVTQNLPAAVTVASDNEDVAKFVASTLRHKRFRCYANNDPIGVQVAGAVKNVLAIACGIVRGKGLGNNATAGLITRGLAEMRRLGLALGGKSDTFFGLSGVGDVTLTCSSEQSRNMRLGLALGQNGNSIEKVLKESPFISEGVPTAAAVHNLSQALSIPMPLCQAVYAILYGHVNIDKVVEAILARQAEWEFP